MTKQELLSLCALMYDKKYSAVEIILESYLDVETLKKLKDSIESKESEKED